jgi:alkylated DNA nucleotide flippase Atl1
MPAWVLKALTAARRVPWRRVIAAVVWLATAGREYWNRLTADERRELLDLVKKSRGARSNLSQAEQDRVVALLEKIRRGVDRGDG